MLHIGIGYLVFLKPLLSIMNYSEIRVMNCIFQILIIILLIVLLFKRKLTIIVIPILSVYILTQPIALINSLQFSCCWNITCISLICYLIFKDTIVDKKVHYLFFTIIGMVSSYFDLLTYPIITLGIPLVVTLVAENLTVKESIKRILLCGSFWTLGYAIMWISKWILASLFLNKNILKNAFEDIKLRSSNEIYRGITPVAKIRRLDGIFKILKKFIDLPVIEVILVNIITCVGWFNYKIKGFSKGKCKNVYKVNQYKIKGKNIDIATDVISVIPFVAIACMPFVWYIVLANHSQVHDFFTFRSALVCWFGMLVALHVLTRKIVIKNI